MRQTLGDAGPDANRDARPDVNRGARWGDAGFTLLEVLVSVAVIGLILAGLTQGFHFGTVAWNAQARVLAGGGELDAVDRALRRLITRMDPAGDALHPPLLGTASGMVFAATMPQVMSATDGRRAAMRLSVEAGRLVLRWVPAPHAVALAPPVAAETEVLRGVRRLELGFYGALDGQGPAWRSAWAGPHLPALIRVRVVFADDDPRRWADIVEAPRARPPP